MRDRDAHYETPNHSSLCNLFFGFCVGYLCLCAGLFVYLCSCRRRGTESRLCLRCRACQSSLHLQSEVWKYQLCNPAHCLAADTHMQSQEHPSLKPRLQLWKFGLLFFVEVIRNINYNYRIKNYLFFLKIDSVLLLSLFSEPSNYN